MMTGTSFLWVAVLRHLKTGQLKLGDVEPTQEAATRSSYPGFITVCVLRMKTVTEVL